MVPPHWVAMRTEHDNEYRVPTIVSGTWLAIEGKIFKLTNSQFPDL